MKLVMTDGEAVLTAKLNETLAAKEFAGRLPLRLKGRDGGTDYCFPVARGIFDPMEIQTGWKNGDISIWDGCFCIFYGGEEEAAYTKVMIIGHLDDESLKKVYQLPQRVTLTIQALPEKAE